MQVVPGEKILIFPHPHLRKPTRKTTKDDPVVEISRRMVQLMESGGGVAIAANQCGYDMSIIVLNRSDRHYEVIINPEIIDKQDSINFVEGCLSFPGVTVKTKRHRKIKVAYDTLEGERKEIDFSDFKAIVVQHEMEHLEGKTFIDKLQGLKRDIVLRKLAKWKRQNNYED